MPIKKSELYRLGNHFLYYWLQSEKSEFERIAFGNTIKTIGLPYFRRLKIPLPSLPEQRAIAAALLDVEALIGAMDRLIAKKRDLKQAVMQQLLTGQRRLPGLQRPWTVDRLGNIADIQRGASPRPIDSPIWYDSRSIVGWVRISDVAESDGRTVLKTSDYLSQRGIVASRFLHAGTLIMSICATVGRPVITGFNSCIHDGFVSFTNLRRVDKRFLLFSSERR